MPRLLGCVARSWIVCALIFSPLLVQAQDDSSLGMLNVRVIADGLVAPLDLTFIPGDLSGTRYIVDQTGLVHELTPENEVLTEPPFFNISSRVILSELFDERGLLGFSFHPDYAETNKVYALYSAPRNQANICVDQNGTIPTAADACPFQHSKRISEFTLDEATGIIDSSSEQILWELEFPGRKHNGGALAFGPDGYLYAGIGDGGWIHGPDGDDSPHDGSIAEALYPFDLMAQNMTNYFGKIIRIDVDSTTNGKPYGIPASNPFASDDTGLPEIYAWGFRNPFRMSFDRNDMLNPENPPNGYWPFYISATAETIYEATYKVARPGNYGWAIREGTHCLARATPLVPPETVICATDGDCPIGPQILFCGSDSYCTCTDVDPVLGGPVYDPVIEYNNLLVHEYDETIALVEEGILEDGKGRASLGGYIYRGSEIPWLFGKFVQGDFAIEFLDGIIFVAEPTQDDSLWELEKVHVFDETYPGFVKSIGEDANGELYAITGALSPTGLIGRVFKLVDGSGGTATNPQDGSDGTATDSQDGSDGTATDPPTSTSTALTSRMILTIGFAVTVGTLSFIL